MKEPACILAFTMREAAGADDCLTHDVFGGWGEILAGHIDCSCEE